MITGSSDRVTVRVRDERLQDDDWTLQIVSTGDLAPDLDPSPN